ncbi:MAG: hypothetical protein ABJF10_02120 [Chthoniobacter sp.]|uniref:hypothetical protein n=1 Tax=Chthoniobacter sp. TaxID=2510640 RepID=UPI0032A72572
MYSTLPHLQAAIRTSLQKGALCRIYEDTLLACWPNLSADSRTLKIDYFAAQNHWSVNYRELGAMGVVAEFEKVAQHAAA